ncbi:MAG: hypothetical protein RIB61_09005 [Roseicyclus sp.]
MSTGQIIQLVLQGLVFIAWAFLMFRTLFLLRSRAQEETGNMLSGPGQFIKQVGVWLKSPEDKSERSTLFFLTAVLLVMILTSVFLTPTAAG